MARQPPWKIAIKIGKAFWASKILKHKFSIPCIFEVYHSLIDHSVGGKPRNLVSKFSPQIRAREKRREKKSRAAEKEFLEAEGSGDNSSPQKGAL